MNGFTLRRGGYFFAYSGPPAACNAVLARMLGQGWELVTDTWGAAVLAAGPL